MLTQRRVIPIVALVLLAAFTGASAVRAAPVPVTPRALPVAYDPPATYEAQTSCSPAPSRAPASSSRS